MAELSGDNIAKLYDNYNILVEAKDKITEVGTIDLCLHIESHDFFNYYF